MIYRCEREYGIKVSPCMGNPVCIFYMIYRCERKYGIKVSPCMGNPVCILYMLYRCERAYGIDIQSKHLKVLNSFFSVKIVFTV